MIRTRSTPSRPHLFAGSPVVALAVSLVAACTGPAEPTADLASLLDTDTPAAERTCLEQSCASVTDAEGLEQCRVEHCSIREDAWSVVPTKIRYDGEMAFVQARLSYEAGGFGGVEVARTSEVYVGCTLITASGEEIDLAVTTLFPGDLERPFTLNTEVGANVRDIIFGVWDSKIEPCDSDRMGCQQYGFLLDGNLATWPPNVYSEGIRQRIVPETLTAQIHDSGLGKDFAGRRDAVSASLTAELQLFGSSLSAVQSSVAPAFDDASTVAFSDDHDVLIAKRVAASLGEDVQAVHQAGLPADFVIHLAGSKAHHDQATAACKDQQDAAYDQCVAGL